MRSFLLLAIALSTGCNAISSGAGVGWPVEVFTLDVGGVYAHDLGDGAPLADLSWAADSSVACWVGTEDQNFNGSHVFFATEQQANTLLTVAVSPEPGLDISIYVMHMDTNQFLVPPDFSAGYPLNCDAGVDQVHDSNPGEVEYVEAVGYANPTNIFIGVAGVNGGSVGAFEVELYEEATNL